MGEIPPPILEVIFLIKETEKINVLNYNENRVSIMVSPTENFSFEPSFDGTTPTIIPMTIDQIRYANNHNAFRGGFLFFEKNKEKEVYESLGIHNWETILTNEDIRSIILNPTYDGLQKIISIKDGAVFERVRSAFHKLKVEGIHDISVRVVQIIDTRYKELQEKKINSSIILEKKDIPTMDNEEVESLKAENKAMQEQLAKMQEMMEKLLNQSSSTVETKDDENIVATKKSVGRPKKNTE